MQVDMLVSRLIREQCIVVCVIAEKMSLGRGGSGKGGSAQQLSRRSVQFNLGYLRIHGLAKSLPSPSL